MFKKFILFSISIIVSIMIFFLIYEGITYIKYQENPHIDSLKIESIPTVNETIKSKNAVNLSIPSLDTHKQYIKCKKEALLEHDFSRNCSNQTKVISNNIPIKEVGKKNKKYIFLKDFKQSNSIIFIIYIFLIFTLTQQVYLFLLQSTKNTLGEKEFHISEWNINTAPMFGLLGTFISIAILLNAGSDNISTILIKNFFDAIMTTIIGIIFYIINFRLKIYIYPSIKFND